MHVVTHANDISVEYTPQAYVASDLDMFFKNFSKSQIGERPTLVSIDGGKWWFDNGTMMSVSTHQFIRRRSNHSDRIRCQWRIWP
jgi:hypothetical protein